MIAGCGSQLRFAGMGTATGLDFGAIMQVGNARGVDLALLADVLPGCEAAILIGREGQGSGDDGEDEDG